MAITFDPLGGDPLASGEHANTRRPLKCAVASVLLMFIMSAVLTGAAAAPIPVSGLGSAEGTGPWLAPQQTPPEPVWRELDSLSARVEVPPGETRVLRISATGDSLEPVDWPDPLEGLSTTSHQAVAMVEPWLRAALAAQLQRLDDSADRFAREIRDCPNDLWRDEIAFGVAHTPPEVLLQVGQSSVLKDNAQQLYDQDADLQYADLVERTAPDGNYTTVSYVNLTGARKELPRDIYYFYLAHPRVFWEPPAKVGGKSLWRKAYYDELTYQDSGTIKDAIINSTNIIEAAQNASIWTHKLMKFGYGTNPLQPVEILQEHYGSCGQFSIVVAAALKVAMMPARVAIYTASDHQWNEFWIDGYWCQLDAASDSTGDINRTGGASFNAADRYEEKGVKQYMSGLSTFRSDDVVINSVDIVSYGPSFRFSRGEWNVSDFKPPHKYTELAHVHIRVTDGQGDPVEGAWVGAFRIGHYVYNASQYPVPHFATLNYTNATGQVDFELGGQGRCSRCDKDHGYEFMVLSDYGNKDLETIKWIRDENEHYYYTFQVSGDAPNPQPPTHTLVPAPSDSELTLGVKLTSWGKQRHTRGEYGSNEQFSFWTSFDQEFQATVDVLVVDKAGLDELERKRSFQASAAWDDVARLNATVPIAYGDDKYLVLSNLDSYETVKVVTMDLNLTGECYPRLALVVPVSGTNLTTEALLAVNGTMRDHSPIVELSMSLDGGANWTDILGGYNPEALTYVSSHDVANLTSGEYNVIVRATDGEGVWREANATVYLDADDPILTIAAPSVDEVLPAGEVMVLTGTATDDRALVGLRARFAEGQWIDILLPEANGTFEVSIPTGEEVGLSSIEVEAWDVVDRLTRVGLDVVMDALDPVLEIREPEQGKVLVVGDVDSIRVKGSAWDENGLGLLRLRVDDGLWVDVTRAIDSGGSIDLTVSVEGWDDGDHQIELQLEDLVGHVDSVVIDINLDTLAPEFSIDPLLATYSDDMAVDLKGTVTDEHGVDELALSVDGADSVLLTVDLLDSFFFSLPTGSSAVGPHTAVLTAVDTLGNVVESHLAYEVVDETDPSVYIDSPLDGTDVARGQAVMVEGDAEDNVGVVSLWLSVGSDEALDISEVLDTRFGDWSVSIETADRDLGSLVIRVRVIDAAGNENADEIYLSLIDRTLPELELDIVQGVTAKVTKGKNLVVMRNASDDVGIKLVKYRIDMGPWTPVYGGVSEGVLTLTLLTEGISTGQHVLDVMVVDKSDNEKSASMPFDVKKPPEEAGLSGLTVGLAAAVAALVVVLLFVVQRQRRAAAPEMAEIPPEPDVGPSEEPEAPEITDQEMPVTDDGAVGGQEEATPEGPEEATPEGPEEATPEGPEEAAPEGPEETAPEGPEEP